MLTVRYRLRADSSVVDGTAGPVLRHRLADMALDGLDPDRARVVAALGRQWLTRADVHRLAGGDRSAVGAEALVGHLGRQAWLRRRLVVDDRPLLDVLPRRLGPGDATPAVPHEPAVPYRLSRFAVLRAEDGRLVAHVPFGAAACSLADPRLATVLAAAAGDGCDRAAVAQLAGLDPDAAGPLLDEFLAAGVLVTPARSAAEHEPPAALWEPEALHLHDRSRPGGHALPVGGTYRLRERMPPQPVRHSFATTDVVDLPVPDPDRPDPPLSRVVRERRSIREHDDANPITVDRLGEFLYRVQHTDPVGEAAGQQVGRRPYPAGGSLHELEIYPVVSRCAGLRPGIYHHDATGHRLERLTDLDPAAGRLIRYAQQATAAANPPQILLVVTVRTARLMWKYEGMGYPLALKHAGVLTELMYLVATAMGLAPCALGAGDGTAFAGSARLDPWWEPAVAEFTLGSRPVMPTG